MENSQQIDIEGVKKRLECDDDFLVEIWVAFRDEADTIQADLAAAIEAGDLHSVEHHAHSLKGMSANIGAVKLQTVALNLEQAARMGDNAQVREILPQLVESIRRVKTEIEELIVLLSP